MKRRIRIGSRESALAVAQAKLVIAALQKAFPDIETELVTMKTMGDKILHRSLNDIGGKGLFVRELEDALRDRSIDLIVHSLKDVTMEENVELPLLGFSKREDPRDALVLPRAHNADKRNGAAIKCGRENAPQKDARKKEMICAADEEIKIRRDKPVGCSSMRRMAQFSYLYPGVRFAVIRGNVGTRLVKLDGGEYAATLLACAGLARLGMRERISRIFSTEEMVPSAGQGILAVQGRADFDRSLLLPFSDEESRTSARAERSFVRERGGDCSAPIGAFAKQEGGALLLTGFVVGEDGYGRKKTLRGDADKPEELGRRLAEEIEKEAPLQAAERL